MIRVLLAEDMHMLRGALVALLGIEPDIEVVAAVASGADIVPTARKVQPDVAVIDVDLPDRDGLTAAVELRAGVPGCHTLILTNFGQPGLVRRALEAKVGGFMLKDAPSDRLAAAVRDVAAGRRVIDSELVRAAGRDSCPINRREIEILRRMSAGPDVPDVATQLCLSTGTVHNYLTSAVAKLTARNRVDAIRIARGAGWL